MDKITLFNQALSLLGEREYVKDTPSANSIDLEFPSVVREAIAKHPWSFTKKRFVVESIAKDSEIDLPLDCLRVLELKGCASWEILGRTIHCYKPTEKNVTITYQSDDYACAEIIPDFYPHFIRAVVLLLASRIAVKITGHPKLSAELEARAEHQFHTALWYDSVQSMSNDQNPLVEFLERRI